MEMSETELLVCQKKISFFFLIKMFKLLATFFTPVKLARSY